MTVKIKREFQNYLYGGTEESQGSASTSKQEDTSEENGGTEESQGSASTSKQEDTSEENGGTEESQGSASTSKQEDTSEENGGTEESQGSASTSKQEDTSEENGGTEESQGQSKEASDATKGREIHKILENYISGKKRQDAYAEGIVTKVKSFFQEYEKRNFGLKDKNKDNNPKGKDKNEDNPKGEDKNKNNPKGEDKNKDNPKGKDKNKNNPKGEDKNEDNTTYEVELLEAEFFLEGYMIREIKNKDPKVYWWNGKVDVIGWYKDNYVIIDWKVSNKPQFWKNSYGLYLHQCLVYAKLLMLHLGLKKLPYILIVQIHGNDFQNITPGLCFDFPNECKDKLNQYKWLYDLKNMPEKILYLPKKLINKKTVKKDSTVHMERKLKEIFNNDGKVKDLLDALDFKKLKVD